MLAFGLLARGEYVPPPFDGGMFANGGFEDGLNGWLQYDAWTAGIDSAVNPATGTNQIIYQNFTLGTDNYTISCDYLEGDASINYFVNDADSGVNVNSGPYTFAGAGGAVSIGVLITNVGTVQSVVDNLKLEEV